MPSSATVIRPVRPSDVDALVTLCAAHAAYEEADYQREGKREALLRMLFEQPTALCGLVVEQAEALVGFATWAMQLSTWDAAPYAHLDCLYLSPSARGKGLGRRLVTKIAREALHSGCSQMQWQTPTSNHRAIHFYERLGATFKPKARFYLGDVALQRLATESPAPHA